MDEIIKQESFVCHKTAHDGKVKLRQCAGHMLLSGEANSFVKTSMRMGIKLALSGRELVFDNAKDCIKYHSKKELT
ncbi:MAG: hypothetical protein JKY89_06010 [Immundisolibacteraceae bacterium]|nr:hypothetical protein [Immundisolibacteraceae bacterium]